MNTIKTDRPAPRVLVPANARKEACMGKGTDQVEFAQRLGKRSERKQPTGFVATCQCGLEVGALDLERSDRADVARLLGQWLMRGCAVTPRFTGTRSAQIEMCECGKRPNVRANRPARGPLETR